MLYLKIAQCNHAVWSQITSFALLVLGLMPKLVLWLVFEKGFEVGKDRREQKKRKVLG